MPSSRDASSLRLRSLTAGDFELLAGWLAAPHVARWWREDATLDAVAAKYTPCVEGTDPTRVFVALVDELPVGLGQVYDWDDNVEARDAYGIVPGSAGIDYLIGHPHDCDRGFGTAVVAALVGLTASRSIWVTPEEANEPSRRVLEKNGFELMAVKQCQVPNEPEAGPTALYRLTRTLPDGE